MEERKVETKIIPARYIRNHTLILLLALAFLLILFAASNAQPANATPPIPFWFDPGGGVGGGGGSPPPSSTIEGYVLSTVNGYPTGGLKVYLWSVCTIIP
jgi:hypothetical protein